MEQWDYFGHVILLVSDIGLSYWQALNLGHPGCVHQCQSWTTQLHSKNYAVITCYNEQIIHKPEVNNTPCHLLHKTAW